MYNQPTESNVQGTKLKLITLQTPGTTQPTFTIYYVLETFYANPAVFIFSNHFMKFYISTSAIHTVYSTFVRQTYT
jgi:hypothetical protein